MTAAPAQPRTARLFLFGGADNADGLARLLDRQGLTDVLGEALRALSGAGRRAAGDQVAGVTKGLLDLDFDNMLLGGWRKHADLAAAARRTGSSPGSREVVELATHRITSIHRPFVEVFVNDIPVTRVHFELSIKFLVQAVLGTVGEGRLLDLRSGHCNVSGMLTAEGRHLITREGRLELPGLLRLGAGLPLLDPALVRVPSPPTQPLPLPRTSP